jgi:hypothetical protein
VRWLGLLGVLVLAGCSAAPNPSPSPSQNSSPGLSDPLAGVAWERFVRDCSVANGGSGRGTMIDAVVKGDVTGDGKVDTLVVNECVPATSRWPTVVEVFDGASDPARPRRLAALLEGDPEAPQGATVSVEPGGRVVVTGQGFSPTAALCCPDLVVRKEFTYANGQFTLTGSATSPRPTAT